jgi:hypothetical protein
MGNSSSKRVSEDPGVVTLHKAIDDEKLEVHPDLERLSEIPTVVPLASEVVRTKSQTRRDRHSTQTAANIVSQSSKEILRAADVIRASTLLKQHFWADHFQISENQAYIIDRINRADEITSSALTKATRHLGHSRDLFNELKSLGSLSKQVEECFQSLQRALIGTQALLALLPPEKVEDMPELQNFVWNGVKVPTSPTSVSSEQAANEADEQKS